MKMQQDFSDLICLQGNVQFDVPAAVSTQIVYLGMNFLLNTYLRIKDKEEAVVTHWVQLLNSWVQHSKEACSWCVKYFSSEDGAPHIQPLLLEAPDKMIRGHFRSVVAVVPSFISPFAILTPLAATFIFMLNSHIPCTVICSCIITHK